MQYAVLPHNNIETADYSDVISPYIDYMHVYLYMHRALKTDVLEAHL